jgi:hypothetical protein
MTSRHDAECVKLESKAEQGQEGTMKAREKELEKHLARCRVEKEQAEKSRGAEEKRFWKSRRDTRSKAQSAFEKVQSSQVKAGKAALKSERSTLSKGQLKEQLDQLVKSHIASKMKSADQLESKMDGEDAAAHFELELTLLPQVHSMLFRHLQTEVELLLRNNDAVLGVKTRRLETLKAVYTTYVAEWTSTVEIGVLHLEEVELSQADLVCIDTLRSKKKSHIADLKSQPKTLKQSTLRIKKDHDNTIRGTQRKFKVLKQKTAGANGENKQRSIKMQKVWKTALNVFACLRRGKLIARPVSVEADCGLYANTTRCYSGIAG